MTLPFSREDRVTVAKEPANSPLAKFWRLADRADYPAIRDVIAHYVNETIPDPVLTTHGMWTISALPSTGRNKSWQRLVTVSCGRLETLFLGETTDAKGRKELQDILNVSASVGKKSLRTLPLKWGRSVFLTDNSYVAADVIAIEVRGVDALESLLRHTEVLDAAYRLNVAQMRQGSRLFAKFHNTPFAHDILNAVHSRSVRAM